MELAIRCKKCHGIMSGVSRLTCRACANKARRLKNANWSEEKRGRPLSRYLEEVTDEAFEFANAIQKYKEKHRIKLLKNSELLKVLRSLGYKK